MKKSKGKDDFLKKPHFIGGDKAMKEFVGKNLRYPEEAKEAKVEGKVLVGYDVTDNGKVINVHVINGIGYGCDEEALRLVSMFKFSKVKNRKMRVKVSKRTSINFKLPKTKPKTNPQVNYTITSKNKTGDGKKTTEESKGNTGYSYTITINKKPS